ncbi:MAG TPA: crossover junction endodeoxyribonuclease RuvC [Candidatus Babeliales bacterium]|nr:crossover junction endodeoxyribonuclease RuvC [Candidatus Babeliales bacterium]
MIVLGIDPGFSVTGFAIIKHEGGRAHLIDYGFLKMSPTKSLPERVGIFHALFLEKIQKFGVTDIALETPFLGKNTQTFLKLGYLRGIVYLLSDTYKTALHELSPSEVKLAVTGSGSAQKEQVARVVYRLFPTVGVVQKADVTDAIAISLCGLWKGKQNNSLAQQYLRMHIK